MADAPIAPQAAPVAPAADPKVAPAVDPKAAAKPATDPALDKAMEAVAERDRATRKREEAVVASEAAHKAEVEAAKAYATLKAEFRRTRDPRLGAKLLEYDDPTEILRDFSTTLANENKKKTPESEIAELRAQIAADRKADAEAKAKAEEEAAAKAKADDDARIEGGKEEYRVKMRAWLPEKEADYPNLAVEEDGGKQIAEYIFGHYLQTDKAAPGKGEVLTPEVAAGKLEAYLEGKRKRSDDIRAKHRKVVPETASSPKPADVVKASEATSGPGDPPVAKYQGRVDFDSPDFDLNTVDPDKLSDAEINRYATALARRGVAARQ